MKLNKKAQITLEASLLLAILVAAALAMYVYLKRSIQGNWSVNSDSFSIGHYEEGVSKEIGDKRIGFTGPKIKAYAGGDRSKVKEFPVGGSPGGIIEPWKN